MSLTLRFLTKPRQIGAIWPSSRYLCRQMVRAIGIENARAVAELGPGSGVITREILRAKPDEARFFAVELDPKMYHELKRRHPHIQVFNASAADLSRLCAEAGVPELDAVVSGLPWACFPGELQTAILTAILDTLRSDGYFTTFAYLHGLMLPSGIRFRRMLRKHFQEITMSRVVWRNLPPAVVYRCRGKKTTLPQS